MTKLPDHPAPGTRLVPPGTRLVPPGTWLVAANALADPGAVSVEFGDGADRLDIVVVRHGGEIHGYINACPHQGTPLEMFPNRFFTHDGKRLLCTTHGAQFDIASGRCLSGPCEGAGLTPVAVHMMDGWIVAGPRGRDRDPGASE